MLINVEVGKEHEIANRIKGILGVVNVDVVYGEYDIVIKLEGKLNELDSANLKIRQIGGVTRTVTLIVH
jgi:uncharacterized protein with GYD domain